MVTKMIFPSNSTLNKYLNWLLKTLDIDTQIIATGARDTCGSFLLTSEIDFGLFQNYGR